MKKKRLRNIGIFLFLFGTILFVIISGLTIWGEVEASFFNSALRSDEPLTGLRCPAFITSQETGIVSKEFVNTSEKTVELEVRTYVSAGFITLLDEIITKFALAPGESATVEVPVTAEAAAYDRIVMVRMHQMKRVSFPYQNAGCGIVVINLPFISGMQFLIISLSLAAVCSVGGILLWAMNAKPIIGNRLKILQAMAFLLSTAVLLTIISLLNFWGLAIIIAVIWLLMGIGMIWQFSTTSRMKAEPEDTD